MVPLYQRGRLAVYQLDLVAFPDRVVGAKVERGEERGGGNYGWDWSVGASLGWGG